jgi:hypothetical protein
LAVKSLLRGGVAVAVSIKPNAEIAAAHTDITVDPGIVVDDYLVTSASDDFVIGECAEHGGVCYGLVERPPTSRRARWPERLVAVMRENTLHSADHACAERRACRRCVAYDATTPSEMAVSGDE